MANSPELEFYSAGLDRHSVELGESNPMIPLHVCGIHVRPFLYDGVHPRRDQHLVTIRAACSGDVSDSEPADAREVLGVSRHQSQLVFNGRGRDQSIGETQSELSRDPTSPFGHCAVNDEFAKRGEQFGRQVRRCVASEELDSSDHRVVQSVTARLELAGATEMVDEDVETFGKNV